MDTNVTYGQRIVEDLGTAFARMAQVEQRLLMGGDERPLERRSEPRNRAQRRALARAGR